jgi:Ni/Fe-hydrogenase b-type cytochrome subunit
VTPPAPATAPRPTTERQHQPVHRWVYLWHLPIRAMHWIAAVAVVVLIVTGFYIGKPYFMTSGEASNHFLMGWMRFLHFVSAAVLIATGIVRAYWLFVGNRFEEWRALLPYHRRDWVNMWRVFVKYLLIYPERAPHYLGHNPLQMVSYTSLYVIVLVQIATGFAMYGQSNPDGMIYALSHWIVPLLGGVQVVRFIHHVLTWVFVIFIPIHVYLTVRADALHREGRISSMVSGGRFVREDVDYVDE